MNSKGIRYVSIQVNEDNRRRVNKFRAPDRLDEGNRDGKRGRGKAGKE